MPFIDQANIACGFHAGDEHTMRRTLLLAKQHNVLVGAHPSYPDRENFGRRSMALNESQIIDIIHQQINRLLAIAEPLAIAINYVKPHGALYNDMMVDKAIRIAVLSALSSYPKPLSLMLQATPQQQLHREEASVYGVKLIFEAFADRAYDDKGLLLSRQKIGAVHNQQQTLAQVKQLCQQGTVTTVNGFQLPLTVDTLCVHGDNAQAVEVIATIRQWINSVADDE